MSLVCGGGVSHFVFAGQAGADTAIVSFTHSKSDGQSAALVHTIGVGSHVPVIWVAVESPASGDAMMVAIPASLETGTGTSGAETGAESALPGVEIPVEPPTPLVPPPTAERLHWYPVSQSESVVHCFASAVRLIPAVNTRVAAAIEKAWHETWIDMA